MNVSEESEIDIIPILLTLAVQGCEIQTKGIASYFHYSDISPTFNRIQTKDWKICTRKIWCFRLNDLKDWKSWKIWKPWKSDRLVGLKPELAFNIFQVT